MGIMNEDIIQCITVLTDGNNLQAKALLNKSELIVLTEHEFLSMTYIDGIFLTTFFVIYRIVTTIIEDDAVL